MKITICFGSKELPEWAYRENLPSNGSGVEWSSYLLIEDGSYRACYSSGMEPEDVSFYRDLKWVKLELERAYVSGLHARCATEAP